MLASRFSDTKNSLLAPSVICCLYPSSGLVKKFMFDIVLSNGIEMIAEYGFKLMLSLFFEHAPMIVVSLSIKLSLIFSLTYKQN